MYFLSIKTSSLQITKTRQICLGENEGSIHMGQRLCFRRESYPWASGSGVFIYPAVASWSYEGTERVHWLHPAGGSGTAKRNWESLSIPLATMQLTQSKSSPRPFFCGGGEWTTEGRSDVKGRWGRGWILAANPSSCCCPVCAASHTSQLISGQIHWPLISRTC